MRFQSIGNIACIAACLSWTVACGHDTSKDMQTDTSMDANEDIQADAGSPMSSTGGSGGSAPVSGMGGELTGGMGGGATGGMTAGMSGTSGQGAGGTGGMVAGSGGGGGAGAPSGDCVDATLLWSDGFESGDYANWTSSSYISQTNPAENQGQSDITTDKALSGTRSQRTSIAASAGASHRVYGGMQFSGDMPLDRFTNSGIGIDAPFGVVNTWWISLDTDTEFGGGQSKWFSPFTVNGDCDWGAPDDVITLGIDTPSGVLGVAHVSGREAQPGVAPVPRHAWTRLTVYVNYYTGELHLWQDGESMQHATFSRPIQTICHFHWGLYANGPNDDIVLFEDDFSVWKLEQEWEDWDVEPYLGEGVPICE